MSAAPLSAPALRPSLPRLAAVEWRKMLDTRAALWLLGITALGVVAAAIGQGATARGADAESASIFRTSCGIASLLLPILAILLVTSEWSQRAGLFTFALVPVRPRVIAAKYLATVALAALAVAFLLALALACGAGLGAGAEISPSDVGRGALYVLTYVSIGFALGLLFRNSPLAIVLMFAAPIVLSLIGAINADVNDVTAWLDQSELAQLISNGGVDWARIGVTALIWFALPLIGGLVRLQRSDID